MTVKSQLIWAGLSEQVVEVQDEIIEGLLAGDIGAGGGLVEEEDFGIAKHGALDQHALELASGEGAELVVKRAGDIQVAEVVCDFFPGAGGVG